MLGGIAQAEVNDQLKDLDESSSSTQHQKFPSNWKSFSPNQLGSFTSHAPIYQVFNQQDNNQQRHKKNSGHSGNHGSNNQQQHQAKFPLVGSLTNLNKGKSHNKPRNPNSNHKNIQNYPIADFSGWNQMNKKQRSEPQPSPSNSHFVLRPMPKNKNTRDERLHQKGSINRIRQPQLETHMRPPPPVIQQQTHIRVKKVL